VQFYFFKPKEACSHYENRGKEKAKNRKAYEAHVSQRKACPLQVFYF
jgi:hypothetical protein